MTPLVRRLAFLTVVAAAPLGATRPQSVTSPPRVERVELSDQIMGTTFSVVVTGPSRARLEEAARAALDEAQRLDRLLSNYRPDSAWSDMNRDAATGAA